MNPSRLMAASLAVVLICSSCSFGFIEISKPKDKNYVLFRDLVEGNSSATEESGLEVYVLIWPIQKNGPWQVNPAATFYDGSWRFKASFGNEMDKGTTYKVIAIIGDKTLGDTRTLNDIQDVSESNKSQSIEVLRSP